MISESLGTALTKRGWPTYCIVLRPSPFQFQYQYFNRKRPFETPGENRLRSRSNLEKRSRDLKDGLGGCCEAMTVQYLGKYRLFKLKAFVLPPLLHTMARYKNIWANIGFSNWKLLSYPLSSTQWPDTSFVLGPNSTSPAPFIESKSTTSFSEVQRQEPFHRTKFNFLHYNEIIILFGIV